MINEKEIYLELNDGEWESCCPIHDRTIARAVVFDENGYFYFVGVDRDDDFGKAAYIETAGGGVEDGEDLEVAICRELSEELGACVEVICRIGVVSDYYNRINRHNINNYFLCKVKSFGESHMTKEEIRDYHLKTVKLSFEDAISEYERGRETKIGRLVYNREIPILKRAKEIIDAKLYL